MTSIVLGLTPNTLLVKVTRGTDFYSTVVYKSGAFPAGATLDIKLGDGSLWSAAIAGDTATWDIDDSVVSVLLDSEHRKARLIYSDSASAPQVWALGVVEEQR